MDCFETKKGYSTKVRVGGENLHYMFGISYWTKEDAEKWNMTLKKYLKV